MNLSIRLFIVCLLANALPAVAQNQPALAPERIVTDAYHGTNIEDPYRYVENLDDPAVQTWFKQHSAYSRSVLDQIPGRQPLLRRMTELDQRRSYTVTDVQLTKNDRYFYLKTGKDDQTGKLYYRQGSQGTEMLLFDPATYDIVSGKKYTISYHAPNWDGSKIAFGVSASGSEQSTIHVMEVATKKLYPERIDRSWFGVPSWLPDNSRFLFLRLQTSNVQSNDLMTDAKTYLHRVGTDPATDKEIFSRQTHPELHLKPSDIPFAMLPDEDDTYVFGTLLSVESELTLWYAPIAELEQGKINWRPLATKNDHVYSPHDDSQLVHVRGDELFFLTSHNAPNFKLCKTSLRKPDFVHSEVVIPASNEVIHSFRVTKDGIYYTTQKNGVEAKLYFLPDGLQQAQAIALPQSSGSIRLASKGDQFAEVWVTLSGWTTNAQRYRYQRTGNKFVPENFTPQVDYAEFKDLVIEEITVSSHDGTPVPLSIVYRKDIPRNGNNPLILTGYGAYGISMEPRFSPVVLSAILEGAVGAVAHVRGGGELGKAWHLGGYKTTKPNTWKDFIACAEYLVKNQYTAPQKIAIWGGSAGGILVGRAMTERPDLFAAAIPEVGVLNALRFETTPNGPNNTLEFGSSEKPDEFRALVEMDAYLHIKNNTSYPATLVTAGMNDPRVIPWRPAKFAARLQRATSSGEPVLFLADYETGHGIGDTKAQALNSMADIFSFALWQTGHPDYQPRAK